MATGTWIDRYAHIFIAILSFIPIAYSVYFLANTLVFLRNDPVCKHPLLEWDKWFGIFLLVLSVLGSIGAVCRVKALQIACMTLLVATIVVILLVCSNIEDGETYAKDSKRIDPFYRLDNYARWAVKFLLKDDGWINFRNCLDERKICEKKLNDNHFFEYACCSPPQYCGFQATNRSWVIPESGLFAEDTNCVTWSSDKSKWCHQCETCQAVYIYTVTFKWHFRGPVLLFGVAVWVVCLGFTYEQEQKQRRQRNNRRDNINVEIGNPSTVHPDPPIATAA